MNYNQLGNSSLKISEISFGCMSLGTNQKANEQLLLDALNQGINFFDTADLYQKGENEVSIGKAFKGRREKIILASKVGNVWNEDGNGWHWNASKEHILEGIEDSLRRLQTDYIDLYQLHGGMIEDNIDEVIEAFERLVEQGKIKHYGISSIRPNVIRAFVKKSAICSIMMQYSLLDRRPEETIFPLLENHNIGILARGGLAQGLLVDKPSKPYLEYNQEDLAELKQGLTNVIGTVDNNLKFALQFILNNKKITSAVVGIRTVEQLVDIMQFNSPPYSNEQMEHVKNILNPLIYQRHR